MRAAAARALVSDLHIPAAEATRRVARQERMSVLSARLRQRLGGRFGGAWIDHARGGRLTVAVLDAGSETAVRAAAARAGLTDTATVRVRHSAERLERTATQVGRDVAVANRGARVGLEAYLAVQRNVVELSVPGERALTPVQRRLADAAPGRYGGMVTVGARTAGHKPQPCASQYACDPPLRSGVAIYTGGARCTSAFTASAAGRYYLLTAGHCTEIGASWSSGAASNGRRLIGARVRAVFGTSGDMGLVRVDYPAFWKPAALLFPTYPIRSTGTALVGAAVCKMGSTTRLTCGRVTRTNVTIYYPGRTVLGLTYTSACSGPGDSGSGVWYGTTAYGILSGGPTSGCGMIYQPVQRAESVLGVRVLRG